MYFIKTAIKDNVINIARLKNSSTASTTDRSTTSGKNRVDKTTSPFYLYVNNQLRSFKDSITKTIQSAKIPL